MNPYDSVLKILQSIPGVEVRQSRFGKEDGKPIAVYVGKREFAHFHGRKSIDIRLTSKEIRRNKEVLQGLQCRKDWVEVPLDGPNNQKLIEKILSLAYQANTL